METNVDFMFEVCRNHFLHFLLHLRKHVVGLKEDFDKDPGMGGSILIGKAKKHSLPVRYGDYPDRLGGFPFQ